MSLKTLAKTIGWNKSEAKIEPDSKGNESEGGTGGDSNVTSPKYAFNNSQKLASRAQSTKSVKSVNESSPNSIQKIPPKLPPLDVSKLNSPRGAASTSVSPNNRRQLPKTTANTPRDMDEEKDVIKDSFALKYQPKKPSPLKPIDKSLLKTDLNRPTTPSSVRSNILYKRPQFRKVSKSFSSSLPIPKDLSAASGDDRLSRTQPEKAILRNASTKSISKK